MSDILARPTPAAATALRPRAELSRVRQFYVLTKPRVVQLIVFCAVIGMLLAVPGWPDWRVALAATAGIWLVAAAAAAFNCLVEQRIDRTMTRTAWRRVSSPVAVARHAVRAILASMRCSTRQLNAAAAAATSQIPTVAASAVRHSGTPGVASSIPMTAQKTMSCTTRGLVSE